MLSRCSPQPGMDVVESPTEEVPASGTVVITPGVPAAGSAVDDTCTVDTTGTFPTAGPRAGLGVDSTSGGVVEVDTFSDEVDSMRAGMVTLPLKRIPATGDKTCSIQTTFTGMGL